MDDWTIQQSKEKYLEWSFLKYFFITMVVASVSVLGQFNTFSFHFNLLTTILGVQSGMIAFVIFQVKKAVPVSIKNNYYISYDTSFLLTKIIAVFSLSMLSVYHYSMLMSVADRKCLLYFCIGIFTFFYGISKVLYHFHMCNMQESISEMLLFNHCDDENLFLNEDKNIDLSFKKKKIIILKRNIDSIIQKNIKREGKWLAYLYAIKKYTFFIRVRLGWLDCQEKQDLEKELNATISILQMKLTSLKSFKNQ